MVLGDLDFLQHKFSNLVLLFFLERPLLLGGRERVAEKSENTMRLIIKLLLLLLS